MASRLVVMTYAEREKRIRCLAESLTADDAERDRLKEQADESLARLHRAVGELVRSAPAESYAVGTSAGPTGR
jgi:chromosome condensin MukBEF MukE localization factor